MSTCRQLGNIALNLSSLPLRIALKVRAGRTHFPSPAQDYEQGTLDLNHWLIPNPPATFFFETEGDSMVGAGIFPGSLLVVNRALTPGNGDIVIVDVEGEWMVKRLQRRGALLRLLSENPAHAPITLQEEENLVVFGVVTYVIHKPV